MTTKPIKDLTPKTVARQGEELKSEDLDTVSGGLINLGAIGGIASRPTMTVTDE
jgi:hypothetical protein